MILSWHNSNALLQLLMPSHINLTFSDQLINSFLFISDFIFRSFICLYLALLYSILTSFHEHVCICQIIWLFSCPMSIVYPWLLCQWVAATLEYKKSKRQKDKRQQVKKTTSLKDRNTKTKNIVMSEQFCTLVMFLSIRTLQQEIAGNIRFSKELPPTRLFKVLQVFLSFLLKV